MWGCWRRAAVSISRRNRSAPSAAAELGTQHLERDLAVVLRSCGQVHRGHPALAELALDPVAVSQCRLQTIEKLQARVHSQCGDPRAAQGGRGGRACEAQNRLHRLKSGERTPGK